jgi:hypothetical protein
MADLVEHHLPSVILEQVWCQHKLSTKTIHVILVHWDTRYSITLCLDLLGLLWFCL